MVDELFTEELKKEERNCKKRRKFRTLRKTEIRTRSLNICALYIKQLLTEQQVRSEVVITSGQRRRFPGCYSSRTFFALKASKNITFLLQSSGFLHASTQSARTKDTEIGKSLNQPMFS